MSGIYHRRAAPARSTDERTRPGAGSPLQRPRDEPDELGRPRRALETAELSWISTVRPDGRPHVIPLPAVWLEDHLYFATGAGEQKAHNLAANPHVVLTTGCNTWDRGLDVHGRG